VQGGGVGHQLRLLLPVKLGRHGQVGKGLEGKAGHLLVGTGEEIG
jgi:hypothetical protein